MLGQLALVALFGARFDLGFGFGDFLQPLLAARQFMRAALPDDTTSLKAMVIAQDQLIEALPSPSCATRSTARPQNAAASSSTSLNCNSPSLRRTPRKMRRRPSLRSQRPKRAA